MRIIAKNLKLSQAQSELFVIPVASNEIAHKQLDRLSKVLLSSAMKRTKFEVKDLEELYVDSVTKGMPGGFLLVGLRSSSQSNDFSQLVRKLGGKAVLTARRKNFTRLLIDGSSLELENPSNLNALVEGLLLADYTFDAFKSKKDKRQPIKEVVVITEARIDRAVVKRAEVVCDGVSTAKDLGNMPPNECKPTFIVGKCREISKNYGLQIEVFDCEKLEKIGANLLLSVSNGSSEPPYLVKLTYKPKEKASKTISLVGKGITFDSGGLNLKPGASMKEMKFDMTGAGAVIGAMKVIAQLKPKTEVRGYIPLAENVIGGNSTRPGDVITGLNGVTVEVLNTDAEGRLILADAIVMAEKDGCDELVDLATLTGAMLVALGPDCAGLFTEDETLWESVSLSAARSGEMLWRMPMIKDYEAWLKSKVADIKNISEKNWGGAISGAQFLKHFVKETPWAHIDIAGPVNTDCERDYYQYGATGFGVRTLVDYVMTRSIMP